MTRVGPLKIPEGLPDEQVLFLTDIFPTGYMEADAVKGRTVTSWPSLKTDLKNAGANWVNRKVVEDKGLITSHNPDNLPAFN